MKATLILTTLLGAAIASPVAVQAEKRDVEARLVPGILSTSIVPSGATLSALNLGNLPSPGSVNAANIISTLSDLLGKLLKLSSNIQQGTGAANYPVAIPTFPPIGGVAVPPAVIPAGGISVDQATASVAIFDAVIRNLTSIVNSRPSTLNAVQIQQISAVLQQAQTQAQFVTSLFNAIPTVGAVGGAPGLPGAQLPGLSDLTASTGALSDVISTVTGIVRTVLSLITGNLLSNPLGSLPSPF